MTDAQLAMRAQMNRNLEDFPTDSTWIGAGEFTRTRGDSTYAFVQRYSLGGANWKIIHYPKANAMRSQYQVLAEGICDDIPTAKAVSLAYIALVEVRDDF